MAFAAMAVDYANLVGKYISVESSEYSGAGLLITVWDKNGYIYFMFDYGMGFSIEGVKYKEWSFAIAPGNQAGLDSKELHRIWDNS
jgi:hypothetical protein